MKFRPVRDTVLACLFGAALAPAAFGQAPHGPMPMMHPPVMEQPCDRACLYGFLDRYLTALVDHAPETLPLTRGTLFTENSVALEIGDGLWGTIERRGDYDLRFADVKNGQVGHYGVIYEHGNPAIFAVRLAVRDGRILDIETIVNRYVEGADFPNPSPLALKPQAILNDMLPENQRRPRARMLSIVDGYFDTLQLNDGQLFTALDPACNRIENGVQTTNNTSSDSPRSSFALGCEAQFKLGLYRYDDELRGRRYPLVDEERGLVMAMGFIDHAGRLEEYRLTDGTQRRSHYLSPHSFSLMEVFKVVDGKIRQVEAVFITVPYHMPSPWDRRGPRF